MGRFHRHDDGTAHTHEHEHEHEHDEHGHDWHGHPHDDGYDHDHTHDDVAHEHPHAVDEDSHQNSSEHLGDHSGYQTGTERIQVLERIFDENDAAAARNLATFDASGIIAVNLMSSPGSGKTSVLGHTLDQLQGVVRCGVIEGDIETSIDADRLGGYGAQISLLNTGHGFGGECHLDAPMVARAITGLILEDLDLVLIENVGNLVCPAEFDVGAHRKAMVYSVTEGEDKPLKYPVMFRSVDVVIVNKIDLLPYLDFDLALFESNLRQINPMATVIHTSAKTGEGITEWVDWLAAARPVGTGTSWQ